MKIKLFPFLKAAAAAGVALAALGTASVAQARDVFFSIGTNIAPGVSLGVSNAPYYPQPVYVQPQTYYRPQTYYQPYYEPEPVYYEPTWVQPQTYYYQPAPVYVRPPVYGVTYVRPGGHHQWRHGNRHHRDGDRNHHDRDRDRNHHDRYRY